MQNIIAINLAAHRGILAAQATSDEMLLEGIAEGGRTAMHILYCRHNVRIYRFILRMVRDASMAEARMSAGRSIAKVSTRARLPASSAPRGSSTLTTAAAPAGSIWNNRRLAAKYCCMSP